MSTNNIVSVQIVEGGLGVQVTFSINHGKGQRTYLYSSLEAIRGILAGEDPANWTGVRVDDSGSAASGIGESIEDAVSDVGEL
jgi:hypothetical protein